jgi:diacylglycerol kinase family enzyme
MNLPMLDHVPARPFADRAAFLLNANARAVGPRLVARLAEIVPQGDLFLSRSLEESDSFVRTILRRGYGRVFVGGGDGTLVSTVTHIEQMADDGGFSRPQIGMLKLGTGNAVAGMLGARRAEHDAFHAVNGGGHEVRRVDLVECEDGTLAPFAGMGYDGEVLNDYMSMRDDFSHPALKPMVESVWGYLFAMATRSVPRHFTGSAPTVKLRSTKDAFQMVHTPEGDVPVEVPAGTVLYDGPANMISVGSVPFFGYGFTMFPFAGTQPGFMQLRVGSTPIPSILANLYPRIWNGTFRHPEMFDFLVEDVELESCTALPYQVGGDAAGTAQTLRFRVADRPIEMLALDTERLRPEKRPLLRLGPASTQRV